MGAGRILFGVTDLYSVRLLGELLNESISRGLEVHVVSSWGRGSTPTLPDSVIHHDLEMSRRPSPLSDIYSLVSWIFLLKKVRPDFLSVGTPKASLLGMVAGALTGVPNRVYMLRGLRLESESGIARLALLAVEKITSALSTQVIAVSPSLRDVYLGMGLTVSSKIKVPPLGSSHGVDTQRFNPETMPELTKKAKDRLGLRTGVPVVGFVGRFSVDKGAREIVSLRRHLFDVDLDHTLIIVGPIEAPPELVSALSEFGRPATIVGHSDEVTDLMKTFDVLILPTHREGFPNVVLEANALGIPAVTTDATGAIDSVSHRNTGLIAPLGNSRLFSLAVESLLRDAPLRSRLGEAGRAWIERHFKAKTVARQILDLHLGGAVSKNKRYSPTFKSQHAPTMEPAKFDIW